MESLLQTAPAQVIDLQPLPGSQVPAAPAQSAAPTAPAPDLTFSVSPDTMASLPLVADGFKTSARWDAIMTGFVAAQLAFGAVEKTKRANVASRREGATSYSYGYADLAEVLDACRSALNENGIALMQPPHIAVDGKVTITTILAHTSGQFAQSTVSVKLPPSSDVQGMGSAITYIRRYSLLALLGMAPEDKDDDGARARDAQRRQPDRQPPPREREPERQAAPPRPAPKPTVTVARIEKRQQDDRPYWIVELSDKRQGITTRTAFGDELQRLFDTKTPVADVVFVARGEGKRPYVDQIVPVVQ